MSHSRSSSELNGPERLTYIRAALQRKRFLCRFYSEIYGKFRDCLARCPPNGVALELGSGGGFAKDIISELVTSDVIEYSSIDRVIDAQTLPFEDATLRAIFMFDAFHHIPNVEAFLSEARRCLKQGGRILIVEPHMGIISGPILRFAHHEPCDPEAPDWSFESSGPLSDANNALPWIVFRRDVERFTRMFPELRLERYEPHSPLRYWLAGGLKSWSLLPGWAFAAASRLDEALLRLSPELGSFVDIELVRTDAAVRGQLNGSSDKP